MIPERRCSPLLIRQCRNRIEPSGFNRGAEAEENPDGYRHGKGNDRTGDIRGKDHLKIAGLKDRLYQKYAQASAERHAEYAARQAQRRGLN